MNTTHLFLPIFLVLAAASLTGTNWKLTEINGKPVGETTEGKRREMFITLAAADNWVSGNAGCNGFGGTFTRQADGFRLSCK